MNSADFSTVERPLVIGHRGASGHAPENSIAAFRIAASRDHVAHCDGVELDIHVTADRRLVVHHDAALATGELIADVDFSRVRATPLTDGSPIPSLEEALSTLTGVELFVEAKGLPPTADIALLDLLRTHTGGRCHVHAFDHRIIARLHRLDPALSLGVLSSSYPIDPIGPVRAAGANTLWQQADLIDGALVAACHAAGIKVIAWTVNDKAHSKALGALGVDGLCGNWPERLR